MEFAYVHCHDCWKMGKSSLDFGDLDLIFKVAAAL